MDSEEMFDYQDLQGRQETVVLKNIARFSKDFNEKFGREVGHLWLKWSADVLTSDPGGVRERLRAHQEAGRWKGSLD